jgi:hypothetical protein
MRGQRTVVIISVVSGRVRQEARNFVLRIIYIAIHGARAILTATAGAML